MPFGGLGLFPAVRAYFVPNQRVIQKIEPVLFLGEPKDYRGGGQNGGLRRDADFDGITAVSVLRGMGHKVMDRSIPNMSRYVAAKHHTVSESSSAHWARRIL